MSDDASHPNPETNAAPVDAASGAVDTQENRRTAARLGHDQPVAVMLLNADGDFEPPRVARTNDVSKGGVSIRCEHMMDAGAIGVMQFVHPDGRAAMVGCEVRHCRYLDDGVHQIGIMFTKLDASIDPRQFLDEQGGVRPLHPDLAPATDASADPDTPAPDDVAADAADAA